MMKNIKVLNRPQINTGVFLKELKILFFEMVETKVPAVEKLENNKEGDKKENKEGSDKLTLDEFNKLSPGDLKADIVVLKQKAYNDLTSLAIDKTKIRIDPTNFPETLQEPIQDFLNQLDELEKITELTGEQINALNNLIGIIEVQADYVDQEKSEKLDEIDSSSIINVGDYLALDLNQRLKAITDCPKIGDELMADDELTIDFYNNNKLEQQVTAGNTLPEHVRKIKVEHTDKKTQSTNVLEGVRDGLTGEFWTVPDANGKRERLKIFTGTKVTILEPDENNTVEKINKDVQTKINELPEDIKNNLEHPEYKDIAEMAIKKGVDYNFMLAVAKKENGAIGREFGVLIDGIDSNDEKKENFEQQALMAITILSRYEDEFNKIFDKEVLKTPDGKYSPLFVAYFSEKYSPSAVNDNDNDLNNLSKLYFNNDQDLIKRVSDVKNYAINNLRNNKNNEPDSYNKTSIKPELVGIPELTNTPPDEVDKLLISSKIGNFWDKDKRGNPSIELLNPDFKKMIANLISSFAAKGITLELSSGYRPMDVDGGLSKKRNYDPERKSHPKGLAVDVVPPGYHDAIGKFFEKNYNLSWDKDTSKDMQILSHGTLGGPTNHTHIGLLNGNYDPKLAHATSNNFPGKA